MALLVIGLVYFSLLVIKHSDFHGLDVHITYALFIEAIYLDAIVLLMCILSDWTVMAVKKKSPSLVAE